MAKQLKVGQKVHVPYSRLGLQPNKPSALIEVHVKEVQGRSVVVNVPDHAHGVKVASSAVHTNIGVMLVRIGDFDTETPLLDPLTKSLLQYCRLLLPDDMIFLREVRSEEEFARFWGKEHGAFSHVILVGHGRPNGVLFGDSSWSDAKDMDKLLAVPDVMCKTVISLCCKTGCAGFAKRLSDSVACNSVIAPFQSVHGAIASQFCQSFLAYHFLQGESMGVAFSHACDGVPGATSFRLWRNGTLFTRSS